MALPAEDRPPPPPPQWYPASTFDLEADPAGIRAAAAGWRGVAAGCRRAFDLVDPPAVALRQAWSGRAGEGYDEHRSRLNADLQAMAGLADAVAAELDDVADRLAAGQAALDARLAAGRSICPVSVGSQVAFHPEDEGDVGAVRAVVDEAQAVRAELEWDLAPAVERFSAWRDELDAIAWRWAATAGGGSASFTVPGESDRNLRTLRVGDQVVVDTGAGDDEVVVQVDPATGRLVVIVNGERRSFESGTELVLRTGDGHDRVVMAESLAVGMVVLAGAGDDRLRTGAGDDRLLAGAGNDRVESGAGADRVSLGHGDDYAYTFTGDDVVRGGGGRDVIYGGAGDDRLSGGAGDDYLEGGTGDDRIDGGAGGDVVSGGRDDDVLSAGSGDDVVVAGLGTDTVDAGRGDDTVYGEVGVDSVVNAPLDAVTIDPGAGDDYVHVSGSDEFRQRVEDDLDLYRATPSGAEMLRSLDEVHEDTKAIAADWPILGGPAYGGDVVTVQEYEEDNGQARYVGVDWIALDLDITVNPRYSGPAGGVPSTVLYHELAHTWDYSHGTSREGDYEGVDLVDNDPLYEDGVGNSERQAVGLPIDHDGDPDTPEVVDPGHPSVYTENGLRGDLGLERRDHYRGDD